MAMTSSSLTLITLFSLALVASITEARMAPGEYSNGQVVAKGEAMVEAIEQLIHGESTSLSSKKSDCHTSSDHQNQKAFMKDFEPRPSVTNYPDDAKLKGKTTFMKDFEPRPSVTAYPDDAKLKGERTFAKDFEPRPSVTAYPDDAKLKGERTFTKDFEPRPNISAYPDEDHDGLKAEKEFMKDFEPRPNVSVYQS